MTAPAFSPRADAVRRRMLSPLLFPFYLWTKLPLGACAGLRVARLDEHECVVRLPGGWRTQNPFRSTYFAAQAMAAELSTGAPAAALVYGSSASLAMLVREVHAVYTKKAVGPTHFTFADVAGLRATIARAEAGDEAQDFVAASTGRDRDGQVVGEFKLHWSFKRRG
jgi:hypothetical protein